MTNRPALIGIPLALALGLWLGSARPWEGPALDAGPLEIEQLDPTSDEVQLVGEVDVAPKRSDADSSAESAAPQDPLIESSLRSRIERLALVLDTGHERAFDASAEWLALDIDQAGLEELWELVYKPDLNLDTSVALASVLARILEQAGTTRDYPDPAFVKLRRAMGSGAPSANPARDAASWRTVAAFGHDSDHAMLLQFARDSQDPAPYLAALEGAPNARVATDLMEWPNGAADAHLAEWLRRVGFVLEPFERDLLVEGLLKRVADETQPVAARASALHPLQVLGEEESVRSWVQRFIDGEAPLTELEGMLASVVAQRPRDEALEVAFGTRRAHWAGDRRRGAYRQIQRLRAESADRVEADRTTSIERAVRAGLERRRRLAVVARLARWERDLRDQRAAELDGQPQEETFAITICADRGDATALAWLLARLERDPGSDQHEALLREQVSRLEAQGVPTLDGR